MEFGRVPYAVVTVVAAVGVVVYAYARVRQQLPRGDRMLLIALRVAVIVVLAFCLAEPTGVITRTEPIRSQVALLLDRSASMSVADAGGADGKRPRWDAAVRAAGELNDQLKDRFDIRRYTFDASVHAVTDEEYGGPEGTSTDVVNAVITAIERTGGAHLAGVVVLSDGGHNVGTLKAPDRYGSPVFPVAVGSPEPPKDVAVTHVGTDAYAFVGERATVRASVHVSGYPDHPLTVSLSDEGTLVTASTIQTGQAGEYDVDLPFTPSSGGTFRYRVAVSPLVDELTDSNNQRSLTIQVLPSRTRVLLVDGTPRHEFAFLRRTLERLDSVEVTALLLALPTASREADSLPARQGSFPIGSEPVGMPTSSEDYARYDAVLMGDVPLSMLTTGQRNWLMQFVETRGKGVAWLAGEHWLASRLGAGALEELLPVSVPPLGARILASDFAPSVTREGQFHAVTHLGASLEENDRVWSHMPLWTRLYAGLTPKADSTVLVSAGAGGQPVVLYRRAGLGRSLLIATDATWRWGFGSAVLGEDTAQREVYSRFWSQTVRWLATPSDAKPVTIALGDSQPQTGETLEVELRAYDAGFAPASDAAMQLTVRYPDGHTAPVPVTASDGAAGSYHAYVPLTQEGTHELRATATVRGVPSESDPVTFDVESPRLEYSHVARNDAFLKSLAETSGGAFTAVDEASSILPLLVEGTDTREVHERRALWNHPLVFIGVVALLTVEWAHRKRKGLV